MHPLIDLAGPRDDSRRTEGSDLHSRLKDATADAHRQLDRSLMAFNLKTTQGYRRFLEASAGALLPLEAALVESGIDDIVKDWPDRSRTDAVIADLTQVEGRLNLMPAPVAFSRSAVFGTLYVLEGSRLGARYLLKAVSRSSHPSVGRATAYLGHGAGEPLWERFLALLAREAPNLDEEDVFEGARSAFEVFSMAAARA